MSAALSATPAVLTVELDDRAVGGHQRPPEPLSRDAAEVLAAAVAEDLQRILGESVQTTGFIMPAALYDPTEILQPGLPLVETLLDIYRSSLRGKGFAAHRLAIGSSGGHFPLQQIAPRRAPGSGPLLLLPFALVAPGPTLEPVRTLIEQKLLEHGRPALRTEQLLRQQFGLQPVHLTYATFHDLSAMLKIHLEHAGFAPLWQLLEAALYRADEPAMVDLPAGNRFLGLHGRVWTPFLDFDGWSQRFGDDAPEGGYLEWTRLQRQYTAGLAAHGVEIIVADGRRGGIFGKDTETALLVAQQNTVPDPALYRHHVSGHADFTSAAIVSITEQAAPELGPVAYTALVQAPDGALAYLGHEYPLAPEAIPRIREYWQRRARDSGAGFHLERPGQLVVSGEPARLMPFLDYDGVTH